MHNCAFYSATDVLCVFAEFCPKISFPKKIKSHFIHFSHVVNSGKIFPKRLFLNTYKTNLHCACGPKSPTKSKAATFMHRQTGSR